MKNLAKLCVCFLLCFHVSSVTAQQYSVRHIGVLGKHVVPTFISHRGDVVGYFYIDRTVTHAFLWTKSGGIQDLGTLGGAISAATGINDAGEVVGYAQTPSRMTAFSWTLATGMVDLDPSGTGASMAQAINSDGSIAGHIGASSETVGRGVIWKKNGQTIDLGSVLPTDINNSDAVSGLAHVPGFTADHGVFWAQSSGITDLGTLGGEFSQAETINDVGHIAGFSSVTVPGTEHAFYWNPADGMQNLGTLGGAWSRATSLNRRGQVVGFSATTSNNDGIAFLWTKWGGMRDLNKLISHTPDWRLFIGEGINDAGQIVVRGFRGENIWWRALILTPIMSTSVSSSSNPSAPGTAVTFTVKVANSIQGVAPNGATVTLKDGSKTLAVVPLRAGKASFTTSSLAVGTHNITANYSGDGTYDPSKSALLPQVIAVH